MRVLFLSISTAISNPNYRGIYPDLLRHIAKQGHEVYIVCPFERRTKKKTNLTVSKNVQILGVKTLNITKSSPIEKLFATLLIEIQFEEAIEKYFSEINFDLILYATPPITLNSLVKKIKSKHNAKTYLMLKDIFPQNAIDLGMMKKNSFLHKYFERKEKDLYQVSDFIGCMSPANISYLVRYHEYLDIRKLVLCPNAIEVVNRDEVEREYILKKYNIPEKKIVFLYGGNLGAAQGISNLIKVLERNINRKECFFLIVGSGKKSFLVSDFIKENIPDNVLYLPMLARDEYDKLEACCDVGMIFLDHRFTIPNFPSRMLAYLECKLPLLIATDESTDIGKIAEDNNFGLFSLSNDIDDICSKIDFYINNKEQSLNMGRNGYDYLLSNYQVSRAYSSIFNSVKS
jgi:glycosyltransferase involved in cell wall biosynthesis